MLQRLEEPNTQEPKAPERGLHEGERLLAAHADALFGKARGALDSNHGHPPSEAAHNRDLIEALIKEGMDCARINCAHDDPDSWRAMIGMFVQRRKRLGANAR